MTESFLALLGCAAGLALAAAGRRLLAGTLYEASASDRAIPRRRRVIALAVSVVATLMPAIRASRVEPMQILRDR